MELRHLRYFVAVGRCLSFTKAAEMLRMSQPPLSRQIQEFEEEVGAALFDRHAKKTTLTEAGAFLLEEAERLLENIEDACRTARSIAEKNVALKIGCASFMLEKVIAPLLAEIRARMPDLAIELLVMSTEAQEKALFTGAIDLGFVRPWISREAIVFDSVADESVAVIFPGREGLAPETVEECMAGLAGRPYIGLSRSSAKGLAEAISQVCSEYGLAPVPAYECADAYSIMALVAAGLGWAMVPGLDLEDPLDSRIGRFILPRRFDIGMAYRQEALKPQAESFLRVAKAFYARTGRDDRTSETDVS